MAGGLSKRIEEWLAENRAFLWTVMSHKEMADADLRGAESDPQALVEICERLEESLDGIKTQLRQLYRLLYEMEEAAEELVARRRGEQTAERPRKRPPAITLKRVDRKDEATHAASQKKSTAEAASSAENNPPPTVPEPPVTTLEVPIVEHESAAASEQPAEEKAESVTSNTVECQVLEKLEREGAREVETEGIVLKKPAQPGGLLDFLGLWDWFWSLDMEKQRKAVSIMTEGGLTQYDIFERKIRTLRPSFARYCWETANRLMQNGFDELAIGLLMKGLTVVDTRHDKEMLHIMYAKYFYRRRQKLRNAYEACINHCERAIKSYESDKERRAKPVAPFKLLTMIYEEMGEYEKILEVCNRAIRLYEGSDEAAKTQGFKRIKRILLQRMGKETD
ncbi:MAG: hypothetical protein DRP63_02395 [Planctomycetota bacterium]|nr:MAG: hypothetical protein DRP63_02395 [Planctomycetota bacterium]